MVTGARWHHAHVAALVHAIARRGEILLLMWLWLRQWLMGHVLVTSEVRHIGSICAGEDSHEAVVGVLAQLHACSMLHSSSIGS